MASLDVPYPRGFPHVGGASARRAHVSTKSNCHKKRRGGMNDRIFGAPLDRDPRPAAFFFFFILLETCHLRLEHTPPTRTTSKLLAWTGNWGHVASSGANDVPAVPSGANGGTAVRSSSSTVFRGRRRRRRRSRRAARRTQQQGRLRQLPEVRRSTLAEVAAAGAVDQQQVLQPMAVLLRVGATRVRFSYTTLSRELYLHRGRGCERANAAIELRGNRGRREMSSPQS